jgi:hypothetical protein
MRSIIMRSSALLAALTGLSACIPMFQVGCVTDPETGKTHCQGEYIPPPIEEPAKGERG